MPYRRLAESCDNGPCPTLYIDDTTGDVILQGYQTTESPVPAPTGEGFLRIPAAAWRKLLADLPRA